MATFGTTSSSSVSPIPILLEADHTSITVAWERVPAAKAYELQIAEVDEAGNVSGEGWTSLSNKLKANQAKKKNLVPEKTYSFRVRYLIEGDAGAPTAEAEANVWSEFSERSGAFRVVPASSIIMQPPTMATSDTLSITISWDAIEGTEKYRIRYRQSDSIECE
jgi:hypothetical protein